MMKVLTLSQPWATLIATGAKLIETRSWQTTYRGELAIHAAKGYPVPARRFAGEEQAAGRLPWRVPLASILCVVTLDDCVEIGVLDAVGHLSVRRVGKVTMVSDQELRYGNYEPGRYAWLLSDVRPLTAPVRCTGKLGIWTLDAEIEQAVRQRITV